jgi:hypothetical protein
MSAILPCVCGQPLDIAPDGTTICVCGRQYIQVGSTTEVTIEVPAPRLNGIAVSGRMIVGVGVFGVVCNVVGSAIAYGGDGWATNVGGALLAAIGGLAIFNCGRFTAWAQQRRTG